MLLLFIILLGHLSHLPLLLNSLLSTVSFRFVLNRFSSSPWLWNVVFCEIKSFFSGSFFFNRNLLYATTRCCLKLVHFFKIDSILLLYFFFSFGYFPCFTAYISSKSTHFLALYVRFKFIVFLHTVFLVLSPLSRIIYFTLSL